MKKYLILILFTSFFFTTTQTYGQIQQVTIGDTTILKLVDALVDSFKLTKNDLGIITLEMTNLNVKKMRATVKTDDPRFSEAFKVEEAISYNVKAVLQLNLLYFKYHLPNFYFIHQGRTILVYSGTERFIKYSSKTGYDLQKKLKDRLPKDGTSLCPTWWINVDNDQIKFERKGLS